MKKLLNYAIVGFLLLGFKQDILAQTNWQTAGNPTLATGRFLGTTITSPFKDVVIKTSSIEAMRVMGLNQYVGIGTSAPAAKLEVFGGDARINGITVGLGAGSVSTNTVAGRALGLNTTGYYNTAMGASALSVNTTGYRLTAVGYQSLQSNTTGYYNTAYGVNSLIFNTTGSFNTAIGDNSMVSGTTSYANTALGAGSMYYITSGQYNAAGGDGAIQNITTGSFNSVFGPQAFLTNNTGNNNSGLGYGSDVSVDGLSNASAIGSGAVVNASNKIRLGNSAITMVEASMFTFTTSDGRFKTNITEDVKGLDFINKLRPVQYNFESKKFDEFLSKDASKETKEALSKVDYSAAEKIRFDGFIAQEVEAAAKETNYQFSGLHAPATSNDNYSIAYSEFVVPLVKAVQELSKQNDDMKSQLAAMQSQIAAMQNNSGTKKEGFSSSTVQLGQIAPNPFSQKATITFTLPADASNARLSITDATGKVVSTYGISNAATEQVIDANKLAAGVYQYSLLINGKIMDSKQMVIVK